MGNISRANVHDVLTNKPRDRVVVSEGERRIVKRPEGRSVLQWIDRQGNSVWLQMLKLGVNQGQEAIDRSRGELERQGFVELAKCPLRHGVRFRTPALEDEFAEMPEALQKQCAVDPTIHEKRGRHTHANDPCPHILWLIADRRKREEEARDLRATKIETAVSLEKRKLDLQEQQLIETRATNAALLEAVQGLTNSKRASVDSTIDPSVAAAASSAPAKDKKPK